MAENKINSATPTSPNSRHQRKLERRNSKDNRKERLKRLTRSLTADKLKLDKMKVDDNALHAILRNPIAVELNWWFDTNSAREPNLLKQCNKKESCTPLGLALYLNCHISIIKLFLSQAEPYLICNLDGDTVLHSAIIWENMEVIDTILQDDKLTKTLINAANIFGEMPLHLAAERGMVNVIQKLLANGAAWDVATSNGKHPIDLAIAAPNADEVIATLLQNSTGNIGVNKSRSVAGDTYLHIAAAKNNAQTISILSAHGAILDIKNSADQTPLHLAAMNGSYAAAVELLKQTTSAERKEKLLMAVDIQKNIPLHNAVLNSHSEIVEFLLNHNPEQNDVNTKNAANETPYDIAIKLADFKKRQIEIADKKPNSMMGLFSKWVNNIAKETPKEIKILTLIEKLRPNVVSSPATVKKEKIAKMEYALQEFESENQTAVLELMRGDIVFKQRLDLILSELDVNDENDLIEANKYRELYDRYQKVNQAIYGNNLNAYTPPVNSILEDNEAEALQYIEKTYLENQKMDLTINILEAQLKLINTKTIEIPGSPPQKVTTLRNVDMKTLQEIFLTQEDALYAIAATNEVRQLMTEEIQSKIDKYKEDKKYRSHVSSFLEEISKRIINIGRLEAKVTQLGKTAEKNFLEFKKEICTQLNVKDEDQNIITRPTIAPSSDDAPEVEMNPIAPQQNK